MSWVSSVMEPFIKCLRRVSAKCKRVGSPWGLRTSTRLEFWHSSREQRLFTNSCTQIRHGSKTDCASRLVLAFQRVQVKWHLQRTNVPKSEPAVSTTRPRSRSVIVRLNKTWL
jgi:hypothetical protein